MGTKERWCYGTSGHLTFPTLGEVYIDEKGTVQFVYGGQGQPPPAGMFQGLELRRLLQAIDEAPLPGPGGDHVFDPTKLITAVNCLQPLGKDKALAAIGEYLRVKERQFDHQREGVPLLLRALFDPPATTGFMPPMGIGATDPRPPRHKGQCPRFPLMIVDEVPFLAARVVASGGQPKATEEDLDYFRQHCDLRAAPLSPTTNISDLFAEAKRQAAVLESRAAEHNIGQEFLRLIRTVYHPRPATGRLLGDGEFDTADWERITADLANLSVRWDAAHSRYVSANDGSVLPEYTR